MKKIYIVFICVLATVLGLAQTRGISYQALIINPQDEEAPGFNGKQTPLANKEICLRFSFLDSSDKVEYQEIQKIKSDEFGMVNLLIGMGKYSSGYTDSFKNINWDGSAKRLKVEVDVKNDCREFEEISNQVLAYVPFAFYALNSPTSKIPGPKGEAGLGIKEVKRIQDTLFVKLTNDSIINLGNIKGNKGDQGIQGPIGNTGNNGTDGVGITNAIVESDSLKITLSNGVVINSGYVKGNKGDTGVSGANGISVTNSQIVNDSLKVTLSNGTIINAGYVKGNTGAQGPQGIQGLTGATGPQGATGIQGPAGTNGISVSNTQVLNDSLIITLSNGTIINAGYVKGNTGAQGPQGIQGLTGATGPQGATGIQGPAGTNGISVTNSQVVNDSLKVTLSNGTIINAGYVKGNTGPTGLSGINPLIKTTNEPAGVNCSDGGVKIEVGLDTNRNNILDNSEINSSQTKYVCNGSFNNSNSLIIPSKSWYELNQILSTAPQNSLYFNVNEQALFIKTGQSQSCVFSPEFSSWTTVMSSNTNNNFIISFQVTDTVILNSNPSTPNFSWNLFVDDNNLNNGIGQLIKQPLVINGTSQPLNFVLVPNETYRLRMTAYSWSSTVDLGSTSSLINSCTSSFVTNLQFHRYNTGSTTYTLSSQAPRYLYLDMYIFSGEVWKKL